MARINVLPTLKATAEPGHGRVSACGGGGGDGTASDTSTSGAPTDPTCRPPASPGTTGVDEAAVGQENRGKARAADAPTSSGAVKIMGA